MNQPLTNFYNLTPTELSSAVIVFNIIFSFLISLAIVWVYRKTHRGISYSQSFVVTLILVAVLGSIVMMVVQENIIGAFALLGAFSMIRFRTIVKDTKDVAFVFFSLVEGVSVGTNNYAVALLSLILVSAILMGIYRMRAGISLKGGYILMLQVLSSFDSEGLFDLLREYTDNFNTLHIRAGERDKEYSIAVNFKQGISPDSFVSLVRKIPNVNSVDLMTGKESVEY